MKPIIGIEWIEKMACELYDHPLLTVSEITGMLRELLMAIGVKVTGEGGD